MSYRIRLFSDYHVGIYSMHPLCKFNNYFLSNRIFISIAPTGHILVKDFEKAAKAPSRDLHRQNYDSIVSFRETEYEKRVDDLDDFYPTQHDRYVETNPIVGISEADAKTAIEILKSKA